MKRIIKISLMMVFAAVFCSSCVDDTDNEIMYFSDTAIASFSIPSFNTYHHTISSKGQDSIYRVKEDGAKYIFYIDQKNNEIYNPDSLPVGTDARHMICSISTASGSNVYIKSILSDSLSHIGFGDSIDFSRERIIKAISVDGRYERSYKVRVNVHRQLADKFEWSSMGRADVFADKQNMKLLSLGTKLYMFVQEENSTEIYTADNVNYEGWKLLSAKFDKEAYKNAIIFSDKIYLYSAGSIYSSADAVTWDEIGAGKDITLLAGSDRNNIYALSANGMLVSGDGAKTWAADNIADSYESLPGNCVSMVRYPLKTNSGIDRVVMLGNPKSETSAYAVLWNKIVEYEPTTEKHMWNFVEQTSVAKYRLPSLYNLQAVSYADGLYALGAVTTEDGRKELKQVYFSRDGGITWLNDSRFMLPAATTDSGVFALAADDVHHIWLVCGGSGQVWRGRLNKLAWGN